MSISARCRWDTREANAGSRHCTTADSYGAGNRLRRKLGQLLDAVYPNVRCRGRIDVRVPVECIGRMAEGGRMPTQRNIGRSTLLSSFDFLLHTFNFKPFGFLGTPWWCSVLGGFAGRMYTCFGSKLIGSAFVQLPHFGHLPLGDAFSRDGCG